MARTDELFRLTAVRFGHRAGTQFVDEMFELGSAWRSLGWRCRQVGTKTGGLPAAGPGRAMATQVGRSAGHVFTIARLMTVQAK